MKKRFLTPFLGLLLLPLAANADYTVTNAADVNFGGTLRWAINSAVTNDGRDIISFALSSTTISPTGALPALADLSQEGTVIDGTTQPGYSGTPIVRIVGTNAGASAHGLLLNTSSNAVKALIITRFKGNSGIEVGGGVDNLISGCYVMSNAADGIYIWGGQRTQIGGTNAFARNVISSNGNYGIDILAGASENVIEGNYIGVGPSGLTALSNRYDGVSIGSASNRVGGTAPGAGNVISVNGYNGISVFGAAGHHNVIQGNYIGMNASGTVALANGFSGIGMSGASNNTIGGSTPGAGNVISGNVNMGIDFMGGCYNNLVAGNFIGTDASGISDIGNALNGVNLQPANVGNQIGGDDAQGRNVISGNDQYGIYVNQCTGNVIRANYIGISTNGSDLGNALTGIYIYRSMQVVVGGTNDDARNVIAGNHSAGLYIDFCVSNTIGFNYIGVNADGVAVSNSAAGIFVYRGRGHDISDNVISGNGGAGIVMQAATNCVLKRNLIGTDPTGTASRKNNDAGLFLQVGAVNNQIGGRWADEGNVFSGNAIYGVRIETETSVSNVFKGNRIGTDVSGMFAIPNQYGGVDINNTPFTTIGSTNAAERNVISGNSGNGIGMYGTNSHNNLVIGNYIGVDATGTNALGDTAGAGVWLTLGAWSNRIGGFQAGSGNRIAYNIGGGVGVQDGAGNLIAGNSIYRNGNFGYGGLGIDLNADGVPTLNDVQDPDGGGNHAQNFPVLLSVSNIGGTQLRITGYLDSRPNEPFILEFYGCAGPAPIGYGQGERPLASFGPFTAGSDGILSFTNTFPTPNPPPNFITALAHHANLYDTSEFSKSIMLDSDNDGMADGYEAIYFGGYTNGQPNAQGDDDGVCNVDEFRADTNPLDSNSFPRVKSITVSGSSFILVTPCSLERNYEVDVCTNLNSTPQQWLMRSTAVTYLGDDGRFVGTGTNTAFYRILSSLP